MTQDFQHTDKWRRHNVWFWKPLRSPEAQGSREESSSLFAHAVLAQVPVLWQHSVVTDLCSHHQGRHQGWPRPCRHSPAVATGPSWLLPSSLLWALRARKALLFPLGVLGRVFHTDGLCEQHRIAMVTALFVDLGRAAGFMEPNSKARLYIREIQLGMSQHQKENKLLFPPPKMPKGTVRKSIIASGVWERWAPSFSLKGLGK